MAYTKIPNTASKTDLGMVIVGDNIDVTPEGVISVDITHALAGLSASLGSKSSPGIISKGAWIPKLISGPRGGMISISVNSAHFVNAGCFVFLAFDIEINRVDRGDSSSMVMLEGLPFLSIPTGMYCGSCTISNFTDMRSKVSQLSGSVLSNSYSCHLWKQKGNVTALENLEYGDIKEKTRLQGSISYISID